MEVTKVRISIQQVSAKNLQAAIQIGINDIVAALQNTIFYL